MELEKPTTEELDRLIEQGAGGRSDEDWAAGLLGGIKAFLIKNPKRYRGYGPFWWLIKKELVAAGDLTFGEELDRAWIEALDYGETKYNLAAAFLYEDARFEHTNILEATHQMMGIDGEPVDFVSADEDMELR